jgi:hypothetical protein
MAFLVQNWNEHADVAGTWVFGGFGHQAAGSLCRSLTVGQGT